MYQFLLLISYVFRYSLGVNQEADEINMTRPIVVRVIQVENNLVDQEMCLWLGTPYESKEVISEILNTSKEKYNIIKI